jgi:uncharacterized membrane protein YsdA (DUF1294 family)
MIVFALLFYLLLAIAVALNLLPLWLLVSYAALGLFTFAVYGLDKRAAKKEQQRTAEFKLWLLALIGGFAGAALAMGLFRHKTSKRRFLWPFWLLTFLHLGIVAATLWQISHTNL